MKNNIVIISIILVTALMFGGIIWVMSGSADAQVSVASNAKAVTSNVFHDWGEIGINDGNVEAEFEVKNEGTDALKLYNLTTSCSCTNALFVTSDGDSPLFGMHSKSKYVEEVQPGETIKIKAIYDPLFHGPSGVGTISRDVTVDTNDAANPQLVFKMQANVRN
jgi:hypothetical protein